MRKSVVHRVYGVLLLLCPCAGMAQTDSIGVDGGTLIEVVTSATARGGSVSSAVPLQSMSGADFEAHGLRSLTDVVHRFAGVTVKDFGGIGGMRTVSVRNMGAAHTAVVYDGLVIGNTQAGQVDISRYRTEGIETVTVAVGQSALLTQSARQLAAGSVLEITSVAPQTRNSYRLTATTGSFGLAETMLRASHTIGPRTQLAANVGYMRADGTYPFELKNGYMTTNEKRRNSDVWDINGEMNLWHQTSGGGSLHTKACYYRSQRGLPGSVILYNNKAEERLWDENVFLQTLYRQPLSKNLTLVARAKYEHSYDRYQDKDVRYPTGIQHDVNRHDEYYAAATMLWMPQKNVEVALAHDFFVNKLHNNIDDEANPLRLSSLTAVSARYKWHRVVIDGRMIATYVTEHVEHGKRPEDRKRLSPMMSLRWQPVAERDVFLRLMVKDTYRLPSFNDMYYLRLGNRQLLSERATEYNIGITSSVINRERVALKFTIDAYHNNVRNKIVAFPTTYVWKMANFGSVNIVGIDATTSIDVRISSRVNGDCMVNYSWQRARNKSSAERYDNNKQLPYSPEHSGNMSLTLRSPFINVGYNIAVCGRRWSMLQNTDEYKLAAYADHSVTLSHVFIVRNNKTNFHHNGSRHSKLTVSAKLLNMFNEQYEIVKYYPMPGRSFLITASCDL